MTSSFSCCTPPGCRSRHSRPPWWLWIGKKTFSSWSPWKNMVLTCLTCLYMDENIDFIVGAESAPPPGQFRSLYIPACLGLNVFCRFECRICGFNIDFLSRRSKLKNNEAITILSFYRILLKRDRISLRWDRISLKRDSISLEGDKKIIVLPKRDLLPLKRDPIPLKRDPINSKMFYTYFGGSNNVKA